MRTVELPCEIGDRAWAIRYFHGVKKAQEGIISAIYFANDMKLHFVVKGVARGEFGKKVFLTKESAEKVIKEE